MAKKNTIRLTESDLKKIISESVKKVLKESDFNSPLPDFAARELGDTPRLRKEWENDVEKMRQAREEQSAQFLPNNELSDGDKEHIDKYYNALNSLYAKAVYMRKERKLIPDSILKTMVQYGRQLQNYRKLDRRVNDLLIKLGQFYNRYQMAIKQQKAQQEMSYDNE